MSLPHFLLYILDAVFMAPSGEHLMMGTQSPVPNRATKPRSRLRRIARAAAAIFMVPASFLLAALDHAIGRRGLALKMARKAGVLDVRFSLKEPDARISTSALRFRR